MEFGSFPTVLLLRVTVDVNPNNLICLSIRIVAHRCVANSSVLDAYDLSHDFL